MQDYSQPIHLVFTLFFITLFFVLLAYLTIFLKKLKSKEQTSTEKYKELERCLDSYFFNRASFLFVLCAVTSFGSFVLILAFLVFVDMVIGGMF